MCEFREFRELSFALTAKVKNMLGDDQQKENPFLEKASPGLAAVERAQQLW